jgi:hypothetical protein
MGWLPVKKGVWAGELVMKRFRQACADSGIVMDRTSETNHACAHDRSVGSAAQKETSPPNPLSMVTQIERCVWRGEGEKGRHVGVSHAPPKQERTHKLNDFEPPSRQGRQGITLKSSWRAFLAISASWRFSRSFSNLEL